MSNFRLTDEQQHVLDLFVTSDTLIVSALAGSGKTQTLLELAKANPNWDFGYLAFNKAIADEVHYKSPPNMEGRTIHSLAYGLHARPWRGRMNDKRRPNPNSLAKHLKTMPIMINDTPRGKKMLAAGFIASLAMKTVDRFCQTATNEITTRHVPLIPGIDPPGFYGNNRIAAAWVLPYAKAAWDDLMYDDDAIAQGKGGLMKFSFQHYLKLYQLSLAAWDGHADARYKGIRRAAWRKHCILVDECFPAGTHIETSTGMRPIETLGIGDLVITGDDAGHVRYTLVTSTYRTPRKGHLVRIRFTSGRELICTGNHPIRVNGAWVPAAFLSSNDPVLRLPDPLLAIQRAQSLLLASMQTLGPQDRSGAVNASLESGGGQASSCHARRDGSAQSVPANECGGDQTEGIRHSQGERTSTERAGRQWSFDARGPVHLAKRNEQLHDLGMEPRACHRNEDGEELRVSELLQAGRGQRSIQDRDRSRWEKSFDDRPPATRPEKRPVFVVDWVDSVEVLECGDPGWPAESDGNHYVYTLSTLAGSYCAGGILVKNCQDVSPVMMDIVERHDHAKLVLVGDQYQEIYGFTGAINAIAKFRDRGHPVAHLTGCFRFGSEIAEVGNYVLAELDAPVRMRGLGGPGVIGAFEDTPTTVLTRTNGGAMGVMARTLQDGGTPAFASEKLLRELKSFCLASDKLMQGHGTDHHDLCSFSSWAEVQDYAANDPMGDDLQVFVKIVDKYGPAKLSNLLDRCADVSVADVVIGTAHSSKGKEFRNVRLHTDFPAPGPRMLEDEDLRLVYVAVTRAQSKLDIDGVEYFEEFLGVRAMDRPLGAGVIEGEVVDEMDEIGPEVVHSLPVEALTAAMTEEANQDRSPAWPRVWS